MCDDPWKQLLHEEAARASIISELLFIERRGRVRLKVAEVRRGDALMDRWFLHSKPSVVLNVPALC